MLRLSDSLGACGKIALFFFSAVFKAELFALTSLLKLSYHLLAVNKYVYI